MPSKKIIINSDSCRSNTHVMRIVTQAIREGLVEAGTWRSSTENVIVCYKKNSKSVTFKVISCRG